MYIKDMVRKHKMTVNEGNYILTQIASTDNKKMYKDLIDIETQSKDGFIKQLTTICDQNKDLNN